MRTCPKKRQLQLAGTGAASTQRLFADQPSQQTDLAGVQHFVMGAEEEWGIEPYAGVRDQASIVTAERGGPAMTWEDIRGLVREGWHIGAHTVTHPNLSELSTTDPAGTILIKELEACDNTLYAELGRQPRDFAFTSCCARRWLGQGLRAAFEAPT